VNSDSVDGSHLAIEHPDKCVDQSFNLKACTGKSSKDSVDNSDSFKSMGVLKMILHASMLFQQMALCLDAQDASSQPTAVLRVQIGSL